MKIDNLTFVEFFELVGDIGEYQTITVKYGPQKKHFLLGGFEAFAERLLASGDKRLMKKVNKYKKSIRHKYSEIEVHNFLERKTQSFKNEKMKIAITTLKEIKIEQDDVIDEYALVYANMYFDSIPIKEVERPKGFKSLKGYIEFNHRFKPDIERIKNKLFLFEYSLLDYAIETLTTKLNEQSRKDSEVKPPKIKSTFQWIGKKPLDKVYNLINDDILKTDLETFKILFSKKPTSEIKIKIINLKSLGYLGYFFKSLLDAKLVEGINYQAIIKSTFDRIGVSLSKETGKIVKDQAHKHRKPIDKIIELLKKIER